MQLAKGNKVVFVCGGSPPSGWTFTHDTHTHTIDGPERVCGLSKVTVGLSKGKQGFSTYCTPSDDDCADEDCA